MSVPHAHSPDTSSRRRRPAELPADLSWDQDLQAGYNHEQIHDQGQPLLPAGTPPTHQSVCPQQRICTTKCISAHTRSNHNTCDDSWEGIQSKRTIRAENEVEANKLVNNYRFGFRKWKSHVTERPFEDRSEVVKELYSELNVIKPYSGSGHFITCGNVLYVFLFGWWVSLAYFLVSILMFITVTGVPYGKLCLKLSCYFLWPFGKSIHEIGNTLRSCCEQAPDCECNTDGVDENSPVLLPSTTEVPVPEIPGRPHCTPFWRRFSTYVWLLLGYPPLVVVHSLACFISWILIFTIPVSKMNARTLAVILLLPPENVSFSSSSQRKHQCYETRALLCSYHATNWYYYKYTVDGINVFAVNLLPLVIVAIVIGYIDKENDYASSNVKFAIALGSMIPLSYYIGMGIASISAQSNFAVGAVVNATFGSITELTFYITALIRGHQAANPCLQEVVKAALTGTLLGCILFIPGICMIIGGLRHSEQRFNSRSTGVSSALLFISIGGVFAPTLFSKAYGNLVCEGCTNSSGQNTSSNSSAPFVCHNCHYDLNNGTLFHNHVEPLVFTVCTLLPIAYIIGLIFTLKTHSHIYNIQVGEGQVTRQHGAVVHWSRWRSLIILIMATVLTSACADLATEHIQPILNQPNISQYFIGVTVLAMVPEIPEIVNGIQFALQNNISLSLEVGSCIAVQVCMLQIPILVFFNAFYDVGFVLLFSDLHLWASMFSVIVVNYIFMDGKSDYFQGTALVVVYLILLALYYFAPSPAAC
ncbi:low affinity vacuolar monovalent cation/H(+) antiporter-like isoform X1 [Hippoglossus hippoglossus]|uniref:low affinity vacuolar monovalent cation/H(+) antiporter-like isoform X1 n=1 Tax=Hippoglossus hippoglossus TaxID=8267 RepID=UPI00148E351A|nr:low affinity vacuolar monovalent cation/H(+) antiporter-like isoform X1 [Hippoglossus hippoglossus]